MKLVLFFATFLLFVNLSLQIPKLENCPPDVELGSMADGCGIITCDGPDKMTGKGCGQWQCMPGTQRGYKAADNTKLYPDCCGGPICAD